MWAFYVSFFLYVFIWFIRIALDFKFISFSLVFHRFVSYIVLINMVSETKNQISLNENRYRFDLGLGLG